MFAATVNDVAKPCLWAVLKKCLSDKVREVDFPANSGYRTYVVFCDMR